MAIYHLTAKTVSRGSTSAKARHDYIERDGRYQSDRDEVTYSQNGNMPEWARESPGAYWDAADVYERGNGRLFKQVEFALPKELTAEQQKELVQEYVDKLTATKDGPLPYSYAIHKGHDKENPHCHLMVSERANDGLSRSPETWFKRANGKSPEQGGAKKSEALKPKDWLHTARQEWSLQANRALDRAGHEARIDHRSLEEQGIERKPTRHLGPSCAAMERKGITTRRSQEIALGDADNLGNQVKARELEAARAQLASIQNGMSQVRERFRAEKDRRKQEQELQRQMEKQAELERQKQEPEKPEHERPTSRQRGGMER